MPQWIASMSFLELLVWFAGLGFVAWLPTVVPWPETEEGKYRLGSVVAGGAIALSLLALAT